MWGESRCLFVALFESLTETLDDASIWCAQTEIFFTPDYPICGVRKLNLPILCNGAYNVDNYGKYYIKCPGYISEPARAQGRILTCRYFSWLPAEEAEAWIFENPEWEVQDYLRQHENKMESTFQLSGGSGSVNPWVYCSTQGCTKRASKSCGLCTAHCLARMSPTVCRYHGYDPLHPRVRMAVVAGGSASTLGLPVPAPPPEFMQPSEGMENHDVFSRHIDEDWGQHLVNNSGYPVERQAPLTPALLTLCEATAAAATLRNSMAEVVQPVVDRTKRRDREMADKERTIKVRVFAKDNAAAQYFLIAVLAKDWPIFSPKKYAIIACTCNISAGDLQFFQRYEGGLWINYEDNVHVHKDEKVILRLLGVQWCEGYENEARKHARSLSPTSDGLIGGEQPSATKTLRTRQGHVTTAGANALQDQSQLEDTALPPSTGRDLRNAKANTPYHGDGNGWPFKFAVNQHECFLQVEKLLSGQKEIKIPQAFLTVIPQATRWVDTTWNKHYKAWRSIRDDEHHPLHKGLVRAIHAGRELPKGNWAPFGPK
ncbi:hypothetical protein F5146DRAFT_1004118 [Armillaria mellea]|nr:hypothetical protein F5146DRAFT_1004118 [Armillaria mellea]